MSQAGVFTVNEKANGSLLKAMLKVLSLFLTVVFLLSTLGAVAITGVRHFFGDGEFRKLVNETDLNAVKFTSNGKTYTASDYVYEAVAELMPSTVKNYSNILDSIFGNMSNRMLKDIISSDTINSIVKSTMMDCVDYYLNSDVKAAKERLNSETQVVDSAKAYENVKTVDGAIRIYVRSFIINTIENTSGISSDQIIVLLSKNTANALTAAAVISGILLVILSSFRYCNKSSSRQI